MLWYVTQTTQDYIQLNQRLRLIETERSRSHLAAAESMLDDLQAEIERKAGTGVLFGVALRERAILRDDEGRSNEAIPLYERALAIFRAEPAAGSTVLGLTLANLASAHADCGDFASALSLATEAMTMLRSLSTPEFAVALYAHGAALHGLGRNTEALHDLREALNVWEETGAPDQAQVLWRKKRLQPVCGI